MIPSRAGIAAAEGDALWNYGESWFLLCAGHRVEHLPLLVNHAKFQRFGSGRDDGESRFAAAIHRPFD